jgi:hypothetical protein
MSGRIAGWLLVKAADGSGVKTAWAIKSNSAESDKILELVTGEVADKLEVTGARKSVSMRGITFERISDVKKSAKASSADEAIERLEKAIADAGPETDPRDLAYAAEVTTRYRLAKAAVGDLAGATREAQAAAISSALAASAPYVNDQLDQVSTPGRSGPTGGLPVSSPRSTSGARAPMAELPDPDDVLADQLRQQLHATSDTVAKERIGYELTLRQLRSFHKRAGV